MNDTERLDWLQRYATSFRGRGRACPRYAFELRGHSRESDIARMAVSETSARACIDFVADQMRSPRRPRLLRPGDRGRLNWLEDHCGLLFVDAFSGSRRMYFGGVGIAGFVEAKTVRGVIGKAMQSRRRGKKVKAVQASKPRGATR